MSLYEATFIVRQDISAQDVEKIADSYAKLIADNGGKVLRTEFWGLKNLAYIINKNRKGHYVMLAIDAPFAAISEMERKIKLNENILRHLTVRVEEFDKDASIMMTNKSSDEDSEGDSVVDGEVQGEKESA